MHVLVAKVASYRREFWDRPGNRVAVCARGRKAGRDRAPPIAASDAPSFITGAALLVDGGVSMSRGAAS
jgi:hypothetical protein